MHCFIVVTLMIVGKRNEAEETSSLRVVRIQAQAAQQSIQRLGEVPDIYPHQAQNKIPESEIWI